MISPISIVGATTKNFVTYSPQLGDFVIWSGFFSCWHGYVVGVSADRRSISIVFGSTVFDIMTMDDDQYKKSIKTVPLVKMASARRSSWCIGRADSNGCMTWWI